MAKKIKLVNIQTILVISLLMMSLLILPALAKTKTVTIDFVEADLVQVIKLLVKESKCDVIIDNQVTGVVNMKLKDVPLETALNLIVQTAGFDLRKVGNIIIVSKPDDLARLSSAITGPPGGESTQIIPLEHASCEQVKATISATFPDLVVSTEPSLNALIVKGTLGSIKNAKALVSKLDVIATDVYSTGVRTQVLELKYSKAKDIDGQLKKIMPGIESYIDPRLNAIVIKGTPAIIAKAREYLKKVDIPLEQVALEVRIVSINDTGQANIGPTFAAGGTSTSITTTLSELYWTPTGYPATQPTYVDIRLGGLFPFARSPISITYALDALIQKGKAEILANPTITTLNGEPAKLVSSRKFRFVKYDSRTGEYSIDSVDVGVTVEVTPTITRDGFIVVKVKPELSDFISLVSNLYPYTNQRSAEITVRVKDGEPVVIGGLRRKAFTKTVNKIPFLGDIPIFGTFFKGTARTKADNEVVIVVIPRIISKS